MHPGIIGGIIVGYFIIGFIIAFVLDSFNKNNRDPLPIIILFMIIGIIFIFPILLYDLIYGKNQ
jgi:hypothetical protein